MEAPLPKRRSVRLRGYDYGLPGAYFLTLCTHQREILFGEIVKGQVALNQFAWTVREELLRTAELRAGVQIECFVIMPNHIHFVLVLHKTLPSKTGDLPLAPTARSLRGPGSGTVGAIIAQFKAASARRVNQLRGTPGAPLWQRNYHEHVIRTPKALAQIQRYIAENPLRWAYDDENPACVRKGADDLHSILSADKPQP
jgi:REP element-mobilizing transposase RayT